MAIPQLITLTNKNGLQLKVSTFGATITQILVPDKNKIPVNVVVGLNDINDYRSKKYWNYALNLGSTIGRFAGRISKGFIKIDNIKYAIFNVNGVHLHGGALGFDKKIWTVNDISSNSVTLSYQSLHLEEGYPGKLHINLTFSITEANEVKLKYEANTDKPTVINLTNHSYFNLDGKGTILNHKLQINSDYILEVDKNLIPTGELVKVEQTKYDYRELSHIDNFSFNGLDDTFVSNKSSLKAILESDYTGIRMNVYSNQPATVVYTPPKFPELNFNGGVKYSKFPAICFETQFYPDSPHHKNFPSTILRPNEIYVQETSFEFSLV